MDFLTPEFALKVLLTVGGFLLLLWRVAVWFGRTVSSSLQVHHDVQQLTREVESLDSKHDQAHEKLQQNTEALRARIDMMIERIARLEAFRGPRSHDS